MRTYKVTLISGQVLTVKSEGVVFGPSHVQFVNLDGRLVRAFQAGALAEVAEEQPS